MTLDRFHPAVAAWFRDSFPAPTACQAQAWPAIMAGRHTLIAAPTGSGKTVAAFLAAIDALVRQSQDGALPDETQVVYVSPLKALSNDIQRNLEQPLQGIRAELRARGLPDVEIRAMVRTGDTPQSERTAMRKRPPHICVTTPESLYILLTSESGRAMLRNARTVIVDEIHAIAGTKRGSHLSLSLERLAALTATIPVRVGLSATQRPIEDIARLLVGNRFITADGHVDCAIIDTGHVRARELAIEIPNSPLQAVMSNEVWEEVYERLAALIAAHRTTLVFVNTRRMAERAARHLSERIGEAHVSAHHGSLAREQRLTAEQRLKSGGLRALVATASLELGIDIGEVDLVCQLGSTRSIATWLQRVGRSGHAIDGLPKGRLFPLSRDDLIECVALLDAVRRGELDRLSIPSQPLDVLAQQLVAMVACEEWSEEALFDVVSRAYPYRGLAREAFDAVVRMLAEGFATRRGRRAAYLHRDAVNRRLRARRGARLTAITSGGAIPDSADYEVRAEPTGAFVGTVNEDFAIESLAGDIFQLGNTSWRILRVEAGVVRVEDAHGQPPTIPFWLGEAPARTDELSFAVSRLREEIERGLSAEGLKAPRAYLVDTLGMAEGAADQVVDYLAAAKAALGVLPTQRTLVLERFFDESGGMQLVLHSAFGSRVNRAFGFALRKRFCRKFNFELQAAATEDAVVLSLGETHSFPLDEVWHYLKSASVRELLVQAVLDAPMFKTRWRWTANIALAVPRFRAGKKMPARLQRMQADDLVALVFPDQLACLENVVGEREIPVHPLVQQTLCDCLNEAMDVAGLERLLEAIERGEKRLVARDLAEPSPLAQEILNAKPYAFLDDAPLEERRTQAVMSRRWLDPETASDLGRLDPEAIERVRREAWPEAGSADELHDALLWLDFVTEAEGRAGRATPQTEVPAPTARGWREMLDELIAARRAAVLDTGRQGLWVAAERLPQLQAVFPKAALTPEISAPEEYSARHWSPEEALVELVRSRLEGLGPVTVAALAHGFGLPEAQLYPALVALEGEGFSLRGSYTGVGAGTEWCERRLLARIHRYTVQRLRQEIEPVASADFQRFLLRWQHATARLEGPQGLAAVIEQLEGYEAPAAAWEGEILPVRIVGYQPDWLDSVCLSGRFAWTRLAPPKNGVGAEIPTGPVRTTPIAFLSRKRMPIWRQLTGYTLNMAPRRAAARRVAEFLGSHGASFFDDLVDRLGLLRTQVEGALGELVAQGLVSSDSFAGLRALLTSSGKRRAGRRQRHSTAIEDAGRWALTPHPHGGDPGDNGKALAGGTMAPERGASHEALAWTLLRRYGVVCRRLLLRESALPPWRDLVRIYHRLEARGEIRGGRFLAGVAGEQFALPEAVGLLREMRRTNKTGELVSISAADPLNLVGIITPGARVPALAANRILYRDGVPIAVQQSTEVSFLDDIKPGSEWELKKALVRRTVALPSSTHGP